MSAQSYNIGPHQRQRRVRSGLIALALGLSFVGLLLFIPTTPWWRLGALPLFWIALLGFFQAREKT
jgi:hypothetical protein